MSKILDADGTVSPPQEGVTFGPPTGVAKQIFSTQLQSFGVKYYFVNRGLYSESNNAELLATIHGAFDLEYISAAVDNARSALGMSSRPGKPSI